MRKFLAIAACALFVSAAQAGVPVTYGVRAGMNVSNMKYSSKYTDKMGAWYNYSESGTANARVGYNLGAIVDIPVFKQYLYVQPGLYFTRKGYKYSENNYGDSYKESMNPTYLEIPILISGRYYVGKKKNAQLQVNFGPYFAVGLGGKMKIEETEGKYKDKYEYKMFAKAKDGYYDERKGEYIDGNDNLGFKRFDAGLSIGAGVLLYKHYFVGFQYEFGLVNMLSSDYQYNDYDEEYKNSLKNRNFMLSVGYNF